MTSEQLLSPEADSDGTTVTMESTIEPNHVAVFWELYLKAFGPLRVQAVARHVMHRHEFIAQMADPRVWKYVAWDEDGTPVGLTTLTCHLETVPWISPEYFQAKFPEEAARHAVFYLGFTLADPDRRQSRLMAAMLAPAVARAVEAKAVCAYDLCGFNNESLQLDKHIAMSLHQLADVTVAKIDTQRYYTADFR